MRNRISGLLRSLRRDMQLISPHSIQNAQGIPLAQMLHQVVVSVGVNMEQVQPAGKDHPDLGQKVSIPHHQSPLWVSFLPGLHGLQRLQDLSILHIAKQQPLLQNAKESPFFHHMVSLLFHTFPIR